MDETKTTMELAVTTTENDDAPLGLGHTGIAFYIKARLTDVAEKLRLVRMDRCWVVTRRDKHPDGSQTMTHYLELTQAQAEKLAQEYGFELKK